MEVLWKDPIVLGSILVMPIVIIGLAVSWKKIKVKKAEATASKSPAE